MDSLPVIFYVLLAYAAVLSGIFDFGKRRIPNWITIPSLFFGIALNALRDPNAGLRFSLLGLGAALLVYVPLYLLRGMGAGDVKLMGAIGAIVGPRNWLLVFLAAALIGGLAALVLALRMRRFHNTLQNVSILIDDLMHFRAPYKAHAALDVTDPRSLRLPHGVSIAAGSLALVAAAWGSPR